MNRQQEALEFKCNSKQIVEKNDFQKINGSSLYRRLQGNGKSSYQNGYSQSSIHEEKGFLRIPENAKNPRASGFDMHRKGLKNFQQLLTIENTEWELESGCPVVEKTVYVDSVHTEKSPILNSSSLDMKGFTDDSGNYLEIPEKISDMKDNLSIDSSVQDIKHLTVLNEKAVIKPKSLESFDSCSMSSDRSTHDIEIDMKNGSRHDEDLIQDSIALKISKVADRENFDPQRKQFGKLGGQENYCVLPEDSLSLVCLKAADDKETDTESKTVMELGDQEGLNALLKDPITLESSRMTVDQKKINSTSPEPKKPCIEESSHSLVQRSIMKVANDKKIDLENERNVKLGSQGEANGSLLLKPLALPLPKSPSESWLKRTLPAISSRNASSSSRSSLAARICTSGQVSNASNLDPKWETIVKTSNVHHGHLRFSEVNSVVLLCSLLDYTGVKTKI